MTYIEKRFWAGLSGAIYYFFLPFITLWRVIGYLLGRYLDSMGIRYAIFFSFLSTGFMAFGRMLHYLNELVESTAAGAAGHEGGLSWGGKVLHVLEWMNGTWCPISEALVLITFLIAFEFACFCYSFVKSWLPTVAT